MSSAVSSVSESSSWRSQGWDGVVNVLSVYSWLLGEAGARVSGDLTCVVCCIAEMDPVYTHIQRINISIWVGTIVFLIFWICFNNPVFIKTNLCLVSNLEFHRPGSNTKVEKIGETFRCLRKHSERLAIVTYYINNVSNF